VRRFVTLALSLSLVLGLSAAGRLFAQDEKKAADAPAVLIQKNATPAPDAPKADAPADAPKADAKPADETPKADEAPKPIPPEVEAKLEAARKAVAEAIVAVQDAGLVDTSIEPPPILDILITGRADDAKALKAITKESPEAGVSPEVFGAWYTGYGKTIEGVTPNNIRIIQPSKGLKDWYAARAAFLTKYIDEARKAKAAEPKPDEAKPADEKKPDAPADEAKPADEKKPDAPADEPKTEEAPKADDAKPADEPKTEEAPKADDAKPADEPKTDDAKPADEPKAEEAPQV
jgi:hypothetical protein